MWREGRTSMPAAPGSLSRQTLKQDKQLPLYFRWVILPFPIAWAMSGSPGGGKEGGAADVYNC